MKKICMCMQRKGTLGLVVSDHGEPGKIHYGLSLRSKGTIYKYQIAGAGAI